MKIILKLINFLKQLFLNTKKFKQMENSINGFEFNNQSQKWLLDTILEKLDSFSSKELIVESGKNIFDFNKNPVKYLYFEPLKNFISCEVFNYIGLIEGVEFYGASTGNDKTFYFPLLFLLNNNGDYATTTSLCYYNSIEGGETIHENTSVYSGTNRRRLFENHNSENIRPFNKCYEFGEAPLNLFCSFIGFKITIP